jgi:CRP-like cAMP-binding protein
MLGSEHKLQPFLNRLTSRSVLSDLEKQAILALPFETKFVPANHDLVRLSEHVDHTCFIAEGLVARFDQNALGKRQITSLYIAGDMPDLLSVVQPKATSALFAVTGTTVLRIRHRALREAMTASPALTEAFWRDCMVDAMIMAEWVVNVGRRNARSRIAHLLCEMAYRYRVSDRDGTIAFRLPMTQDHLADATGLTPVHVNRTLKALAADGVSLRNKTVHVDDWSAMVRIGEFDSSYLQADIKPDERIRIVQHA